MSIFGSLKPSRGRAVFLFVFLGIVLLANSSAAPAQEGEDSNNQPPSVTQSDKEKSEKSEESEKPKEPKKDPPPMRHQPSAEADSLEDFAPSNAKNKKLKKEKDDKKGAVEISPSEDTFATSDDLVFLVESGTFTETLTLEFEHTKKKSIPIQNEESENDEKLKADKIHVFHDFQVEIVNPLNGKVHHNFEQRVRIGVDVREFGIDLEEMGGTFFIAYRNPYNPNELIDVPIKTHDRLGLISADVTHFSDWTAGWRPEGWALHWDLPSASGFNGAANYNYSIEVPPGHNGMQPMVNLSYSSSAINGAIRTVSSGTVAAGWSLNEIAVVRTGVELTGENRSRKPQKYRLVMNGTGYELVRKGTETLNVGQTTSGFINSQYADVYVLKDHPSVRALRFGDDSKLGVIGGTADTPIYWIIQLPDGKSYRLGRWDWARTTYQLKCFCGTTNQNLEQEFDLEWHVDTATDAYGNMIAYKRNNSIETDQTDVGGTSLITKASRVTNIYYNFDQTTWSHPVAGPFTHMGHLNINNAGTEIKFLYVANKPQLEAIEVIHDRKNRNYATRRYDIHTVTYTYANECTRRLTDPVLTSTKALWAITEKGRNTSGGAWQELPTQRFEYEIKSNFDKPVQNSSGVRINGTCFSYYRLKRVENGYGAVLEFDYTSDGRENDSGAGQYRDTGSGPTEFPNFGNSWYVTEMRVNDGAGHLSKTKYARSGRCYVQENAAYRCPHVEDSDRPEYGVLAGFNTVTTDVLEFGSTPNSERILQRTVTTYNQGSVGFGQPSKVVSYSSGNNGALQRFQEVDTTYHDYSIYGTKFRPINVVDTTQYTIGSATNMKSRINHTYDTTTNGYGNLKDVKTYTHNGSGYQLYQTQTTLYLSPKTNNNLFWVSRVDKQQTKDKNGTLLTETKYLYNTDGSDRVTPTSVSSGMGSSFITTKTEYNSRGNVKATIDPKQNRTEIAYDTQYGLYPVRVKVLANNSCTFFKVYGFPGTQCNNQNSGDNNGGLAGLLHQVSDPNNLVTKYEYDVHGRLIKTYTPNDSSTAAVTQTYYDFEVPFQVKTETRDGLAPTAIQYYDGLGRPFMSEQQGALVGTSSQNLLSLTGYDELGQIARQTIPVQKPSAVEDRFYSYVASTDSFKLAGYRDSFGDSSLDSTEWSKGSNMNVSMSQSFLTADMSFGEVGVITRNNPDTAGRSGDDVWGFDFAARNMGGNGRVAYQVVRGTWNGTGSNKYRAVFIRVRENSSQINVGLFEQDGNNPAEVAILNWEDHLTEDDLTVGDDRYSKWYHAEIKRSGSNFTIKITQKDNPSVTGEVTLNASSSYNTDDWKPQFRIEGANAIGHNSTYIDNYYEYVTGTNESVNWLGTKTVYGYTKATDTLKHPADTRVILADNSTTTTLNSVATAPTINGLNRFAKQVNTDAEGHQTSYLTNVLGQLSMVREHNSNGSTYTDARYHYDDLGNLTTVLRKNSSGTTLTTTTMGYDVHGRKIQMNDPDMGIWNYGYDAASNLVTQTDAENNRLCFYYDGLNRMTTKSTTTSSSCPNNEPAANHSGNLATYEYDTGVKGIGKLARVNYGSGLSSFTQYEYDIKGRLENQRVVLNVPGVSKQWFNMKTLAFDALNRPTV
ncbi:MAG: DUF6443 domain-containing protein, partial [Chloroflexota bacterium]